MIHCRMIAKLFYYIVRGYQIHKGRCLPGLLVMQNIFYSFFFCLCVLKEEDFFFCYQQVCAVVLLSMQTKHHLNFTNEIINPPLDFCLMHWLTAWSIKCKRSMKNAQTIIQWPLLIPCFVCTYEAVRKDFQWKLATDVIKHQTLSLSND